MRRYTTDSVFAIGASHVATGKACQDYTLSRVSDTYAYAIVSDGCSSGGMTDVGARVLALATATAIRATNDVASVVTAETPQQVEHTRAHLLSTTQAALGLAVHDMLATSVYAYVTENGGYAIVQGDGVVAFVYKDGTIHLHRFDWPDNTPFYPAYTGEGLENFFAAHNAQPHDPILTHEVYTGTIGGFYARESTEVHSMSEGVRGVVIPITPAMLDQLAFVAVFSDGVYQVDQVHWISAAEQLLAFKNTNGAFVTRRMNRFLADAQRTGRGSIDDLALAVIHIQQPPSPSGIKDADLEKHQGHP